MVMWIGWFVCLFVHLIVIRYPTDSWMNRQMNQPDRIITSLDQGNTVAFVSSFKYYQDNWKHRGQILT